MIGALRALSEARQLVEQWRAMAARYLGVDEKNQVSVWILAQKLDRCADELEAALARGAEVQPRALSEARLRDLIERMRAKRSRWRLAEGSGEAVYSAKVDEWANTLEAIAALVRGETVPSLPAPETDAPMLYTKAGVYAVIKGMTTETERDEWGITPDRPLYLSLARAIDGRRDARLRHVSTPTQEKKMTEPVINIMGTDGEFHEHLASIVLGVADGYRSVNPIQPASPLQPEGWQPPPGMLNVRALLKEIDKCKHFGNGPHCTCGESELHEAVALIRNIFAASPASGSPIQAAPGVPQSAIRNQQSAAGVPLVAPQEPTT